MRITVIVNSIHPTKSKHIWIDWNYMSVPLRSATKCQTLTQPTNQTWM